MTSVGGGHIAPMLLHGIFPPITTPFYPDGRVYLKKLEHNVERYSKTPVAGVVVLGSTGESIMLSDDERRQALMTARGACGPNKVLVAGTGIESAIETLRLTEYAAELGYDVALIRTPHFYKPQMKSANLLAFYRTVADRSPIPILIYSVPVFTGYDMPVDIIAELAEHPNVIGIKESGGNADKIREMVGRTKHIKRKATVTETFAAVTPRMLRGRGLAADGNTSELIPVGALAGSSATSDSSDFGGRAARASSSAVITVTGVRTREKEVGFQILAGAAQRFLPSLEAGAVGGVLAFATLAPTACYEVYAAWKEGDAELAQLKQQRIANAATRVGAELGIPALKYACDLNGYYGGPPRLPFLPLTADLKAEVEQLMGDIRN